LFYLFLLYSIITIKKINTVLNHDTQIYKAWILTATNPIPVYN